jgi:hypothetical protein
VATDPTTSLGAGRDRPDGYLGTDTCTGFEVVVSCEET